MPVHSNHKNKAISLIEANAPLILLGLAAFSFFIFFYPYVFFYQEKVGFFYISDSIIADILIRPGSALMILSQIITSLYIFPFVGALILTSVIVISTILVRQIIRAYFGADPIGLSFITGGTLMILHCDYHFPLLFGLGLVLQLAVSHLTLKVKWLVNRWMPLLLFPFWYVLTGSFAFIFAIHYSLYLLLRREKWALIQCIALWLIQIVFIYLSKEYLFYFSLEDLLVFPLKSISPEILYQIFLSLVLVLSFIPIIGLLKTKYFNETLFFSRFFRWGIPTLSLIIFISIGIVRFSQKDKHYFQVENLFLKGEYNQLIYYNLRNKSANILTSFLNNIALSKQGKLNDMLFMFPQSPDGKTLFLSWDLAGEILKRGGYLYYEIGMFNEAHRWAYENMVMYGYSPEGLKMLIKTELIDGNLSMARKYINLLDQSLFYKKDAAIFRQLAADSTSIFKDAELTESRTQRVKNDFFVLADDPYLNLLNVVKYNSQNRKALEYEMAYLLLKKDFKGIVKNLGLYEQLSVKKLPIHIEEAVVAYKTLGMGDDAVIDRMDIRPETIEKFTRYLQTLKKFGNNKAAAQEALLKDFGSTFWYYVFYK
jgi:hypothetical protein